MENKGNCEHEGCNCPVADEGSYCSDLCKDAAEQKIVEIACGCGHVSCS